MNYKDNLKKCLNDVLGLIDDLNDLESHGRETNIHKKTIEVLNNFSKEIVDEIAGKEPKNSQRKDKKEGLEQYELKGFSRDQACKLTYDDNANLQNGVSMSTDWYGNLVLLMNLDHEDWSILKKEYIVEQVDKAIDKWGWLKPLEEEPQKEFGRETDFDINHTWHPKECEGCDFLGSKENRVMWNDRWKSYTCKAKECEHKYKKFKGWD